jgi:micrococcal nuclease
MMSGTRQVWRRSAKARSERVRATQRRIEGRRRRFKALNRPRPPLRKLVTLGFGVFAATVVGGAAIIAVRPAGVIRAAPITAAPQIEIAPLTERRLEGRIRVIDGDTIEAEGERIRIANIDTPEMPPKSRCAAEAILAGRATSNLEDMVAAAYEVTFTPNLGRERDVYGRLLGRVAVDGVDVGRAQIEAGLAAPWRGHKAEWC